jgi:TRAP-type C4-dicarboxylate transport system permease small subunit
MKNLSKFIEFITELFLVLMTVIVSYQVFLRYFLKKTPYWSEEISLLIMVWFGLLGCSLGIRDKTHINVEFFIKLLPEKIYKFLTFLSDFLVFCFSSAMVFFGIKLVNLTKSQTLPATNLSVSLTYLPLPLSGILIIIYLIFSKKRKIT